MARIRTIKPEFWEDEVIGLLSREARLLFIATFNLADDEGLLRWTAPYIKASVFMYDDDLTIVNVAKFMHEVADAGLVFPYIGGIARQQLATVVNFRKHQRINRPQPGKLPPPSLQNRIVREMYARRDRWACQLCGGGIPQQPHQNDSFNLSIDHKVPQSQGGSDYPSNLRATHQGCNKARRDKADEEFEPPASLRGLPDSLNSSLNDSDPPPNTLGNQDEDFYHSSDTRSDDPSLNSSLNTQVNRSHPHSLPEGKGKEGKGEEALRREAEGPNGPTSVKVALPGMAEPPSQESPPIRIDVEQACTLLADLVEANGSRRPTITKAWRDEARRMIDLDRVALADVLGAIRWSQADSFWRGNVMSMPKLRKQYDALRLRAAAEREKARANPGVQNPTQAYADRGIY